MEEDGVGYKELLMARSNKECRTIYGRLQYVSKNEK